MPVTYVTGDMAGEIESPVYAILKLTRQIDKLKLPEGYGSSSHQRGAAVRHLDATR